MAAKPEQRTSLRRKGLRGQDKQQADLENPKGVPEALPEGLERERKGPLGPRSGRRHADR